MNKTSKLHMTTDEFRKEGYKVIDWIADYYENIETYPVLSQVSQGYSRCLAKTPPQKGRKYDDILKDMDQMMPGMTHWQSPNFHAFLPAQLVGTAILADLIATGTRNCRHALGSKPPLCTEVETHVLDWLVDMLGIHSRSLNPLAASGGVIPKRYCL